MEIEPLATADHAEVERLLAAAQLPTDDLDCNPMTPAIASPALSRDARARRDVRGLLLGFAAFSPARLRRGVVELARVMDS